MWSTRQRIGYRLIHAGVGVVVLAGILGIVGHVKQTTGESVAARVAWSLASLLFLFFAAVGCWYALLGVNQHRESTRMLQPITREARRAMSALCRISQANRTAGSSVPLMNCVAVIGLIGAFLLKDARWLGIVVMIVGLRWWLWVRTATPPFVLFLSTSDAMSVEQHHRLKRSISPLRVVSLLDIGISTDADTAGSLNLDCLRTEEDEDWWMVIVLLIELTPVVVINADAESPRVIREATHLVSEDITYKTIFHSNRDAPLLRQVSDAIAAEAGHCVTSSHGLYRILTFALNQGLKPSRERPVSSFL